MYNATPPSPAGQSHGFITLVPVGGLANRMKAIDSALALAEDTGSRLNVIWYRDQGLNSPFGELFQPIAHPLLSLREATVGDLIVNDRPRRHNLFIPRLFQRLRFDDALYEGEATQRLYDHFDFAAWSRGRKVYVASCVYFHPRTSGSPFALFHPTEELAARVENLLTSHPQLTIGIHMRRTDHRISIAESPTSLFIERINEEIKANPGACFYLATDSEDDKRTLTDTFGSRIVTSSAPADRDSIGGMKDACVELYILSRMKKILGSSHSTYSETAAQIGHIPCETVRR